MTSLSASAPPFSAFVRMIVLAWGWQRAAIAFGAGALSVLALAPFDVWPVMFLTLPIAVWLIDGAAAGRAGGYGAAAVAGWWFGFGYFFAGLYWVGHAFLVDAQEFGWLLPIAVLVLPAGLALFMAAGFAFARLIWTKGAARILALAAALTLMEWLRGFVLTGFPWNALGQTLAGPLAFAQGASVFGLWGMTLLAVAIFASPATLFDDAANTKRRYLAPLIAIAALVALAVFGAIRLSSHPTQWLPTRLRIMQPNLQQDLKFNYSAKADVMRRYLALSRRETTPGAAPFGGAQILIWPESAFPFFLAREPDALAQIADLLPDGMQLITGAVRPPQLQRQGPTRRAFNSIYVIDDKGTIQDAYDKMHLVPFGEYLPFQAQMEQLGFQQLTKLQGGYLEGARRRPLKVTGAPDALPLVCYEVIFPGQITSRNERPGWIVNLTNDGWFGRSSGPHQHLAQTRLRAIEEGLPIVRAANTGISAIIDPLGRVDASLTLGTEGVLDGALPQAISPTLYSRTGDVPTGLIGAAFVIIALRRRRDVANNQGE